MTGRNILVQLQEYVNQSSFGTTNHDEHNHLTLSIFTFGINS